MSNEESAYEYGYDIEPRSGGRRVRWFLASVALVAVAACLCSVLVVSAFLLGRELGARSLTVSTSVPAMPPEPLMIQPAEAEVGQEVSFDGSGSRPGSSPIASYEWNFGDASTASGAVVTHVYSQPGNYPVTLRLTAEDGLANVGGPLTIVIQAEQMPEPTPAAALPAIEFFSVNPSEIPAGECVEVAWRVNANTSAVQVWRNEAMLVEQGELAGQQMDCLDAPGDYAYRLEAFSATGESVQQTQTVRVVEAETQNPLANTQWQLVAINGSQVPLSDTAVTTLFGADGELAGFGGCNDYRGTYTVRGSQLSVGPLAADGSLCGGEIDQQEQQVLNLLEAAAALELSQDQLIIRDVFGQEALRFSPLQ